MGEGYRQGYAAFTAAGFDLAAGELQAQRLVDAVAVFRLPAVA